MATTKKFKLNPVVEPFTQEDIDSSHSNVYEGKVFYFHVDSSGNHSIKDDFWDNSVWNTINPNYDIDAEGNLIPQGIEIQLLYEEVNTYYFYVFDSGIDRYNGQYSEVDRSGWYTWDDDLQSAVLITSIIEIEIPIYDVEKPSFWNDEWVVPFISPYLSKVVIGDGGDEPSEPSKPVETYYRIKRSTLVDIANAIREKTGKTDLIKVSDLDDAVKELSGSGPVVLDVDVNTDPSTLDANPNTIIRMYEEVETSEIANSFTAPVPMGNEGHTVSDVKFNTNTSDAEMIELFKSVFPSLAVYDTSNDWERYYLVYENSSNYISMEKERYDDNTWKLVVKAQVKGNGLYYPIWELFINKADNSIVNNGQSWATEVDSWDNGKMSIEGNVITVHFNNINANSNGDNPSGTFSEVLFPTIYVEQVEYVKERNYSYIVTFDKDGNMIEWNK